MSKTYWYKCTLQGRSGHKRIHYERMSYKLKTQRDYDGLGSELMDRFGYLSGSVDFQLVRKLPLEELIGKINHEKAVFRSAIQELRQLGCSWDEIRTYAEGGVVMEIDREAATKVAAKPV